MSNWHSREKISQKIVILLFLFFVLGFSNSYAQDAAALGNLLGSQFNSAYGSSSGINSRVIQPTMSNTPMTTLNGKTSFSAQLECPNSQAFLQIFFEPTSSGDFTAVVSQDPNLSGHFTYQLTTPLISGVCNNGFISCNAGTWNNCAYYQWTYNGSGQVGYLQVSDDTTLGSCFCNNSSCGGSFFGQFQAIANTFGAGLASFIAANSQMAISNVQSSFPTLTYYGQNAQSCTTVAGNWNGSGYTNPSQYYENGSALTGAGEDIMAQQAGQQNVVNGKTYNSPFNLISQNEYMNQNQVEEKTCQISHTINVTTAPRVGGASGSGVGMPPNQYIYGGFDEMACGYYWCSVTNGILSCACSMSGGCSFNLVQIAQSPPQTYSCSGGRLHETLGPMQPNGYATITWGDVVQYSGSVKIGCIEGCPAGYMIINGGPNAGITCMQISQITNNTCSGQDFSKCKLKDEQVCDQNGRNCISIYQDYQYINPTIQPMCYTYSGPDGSLFDLCANGSSISYQNNLASLNTNITVCPNSTATYSTQGTLDQVNDNTDWWIIRKTYECPSPQMTIPNLQREEMVEHQGVYNEGSGVATYPDVGTGGYGIQPYSGNNYQAHWSYNAPTTPCVYSCIVSINPPRTSVIGGGGATTNNSSTGTPSDNPTIDKTYLACNQNPITKQWTCPSTGNEEVIQPCVCLDQGAQSIAIMNAMISAGQDMICSQ